MSSCLWSLAPGFDPIHKCWANETILYDRFSGNTHLLDELCMALIEMLASSPLNEEQILAAVSSKFDDDLPDEIEAIIRSRLDALASLNILQCRH